MEIKSILAEPPVQRTLNYNLLKEEVCKMVNSRSIAAVTLLLLLSGCSSIPEKAEVVERVTSPAAMSLVATTSALTARYRLNPLAASRVYAYSLLAAYSAHNISDIKKAEADAATAGEIVAAELLLDGVATRELDAMRRRYSPIQTERGKEIAAKILSYAATDKYDEMIKIEMAVDSTPPSTTPKIWEWEPTGLFKSNAVEPLWGMLSTITTTASSCDIPAPDFALLEQEGRAMLTKPLIESSVNSSVLLWLAGPGTPTPVGQWLVASNGYLAGQPVKDVTRTLAAAAVAGFDVGILLWREKFEHMVARPETMHQRWFGKELFLARETPGHPAYPSGHSGFSRAVATVLSNSGERQINFDLPQDMIANAERYSFTTPINAANDASNSRIQAFFHYPADTRAGEALGKCAALAALVEIDKLAGNLPTREKPKPFDQKLDRNSSNKNTEKALVPGE